MGECAHSSALAPYLAIEARFLGLHLGAHQQYGRLGRQLVHLRIPRTRAVERGLVGEVEADDEDIGGLVGDVADTRKALGGLRAKHAQDVLA